MHCKEKKSTSGAVTEYRIQQQNEGRKIKTIQGTTEKKSTIQAEKESAHPIPNRRLNFFPEASSLTVMEM